MRYGLSARVKTEVVEMPWLRLNHEPTVQPYTVHPLVTDEADSDSSSNLMTGNRQCAQNSFVLREEALRRQHYLGKHARRLQQPAVFVARRINASTMPLVESLREYFSGCSSDGAKAEPTFIRFSRCVGRAQEPPFHLCEIINRDYDKYLPAVRNADRLGGVLHTSAFSPRWMYIPPAFCRTQHRRGVFITVRGSFGRDGKKYLSSSNTTAKPDKGRFSLRAIRRTAAEIFLRGCERFKKNTVEKQHKCKQNIQSDPFNDLHWATLRQKAELSIVTERFSRDRSGEWPSSAKVLITEIGETAGEQHCNAQPSLSPGTVKCGISGTYQLITYESYPQRFDQRHRGRINPSGNENSRLLQPPGVLS
ncbi:hypothetical protein CLF_109399 [Clonorchis sinensis]|uniref:Uncharacterized protein n=1 Tax=Clonorchis sinensis TaxID=79923 RepID=G7YSJ9_CLOSI|nr:hypothetical protein CLF_109399 [Clonorchis sinensis]